jgi:transcriptional regulator with XRE-family HTH domain
VNSTDEQFFKALGSRICQARKRQNLTQQQVADQLGIPQQTFANYEIGYTRLPASMLPTLGQLLGLTPNDLLGHSEPPKNTKRGPVSKLDLQFERIRQLPRATQQVLIKMLDGVLAEAGH